MSKGLHGHEIVSLGLIYESQFIVAASWAQWLARMLEREDDQSSCDYAGIWSSEGDQRR